MQERKLIVAIERLARGRRERTGRAKRGAVRLGIGDDCALLRVPAGREALVTTDFSLEGVHFRREWHPPEVVGHRCLARGLSDIAAMGGEPMAAFLSLALPAKLPQRWVYAFLRGFLKLARRYGVELAGGDVAQSPSGVLADVVVLGSAPQGRAVTRSGARPGDGIYVTGVLGGSVAALEEMRKAFPVSRFPFSEGNAASVRQVRTGKQLRDPDFARHFFPEPWIAVGARLRGIASAMIDTSDGLSTDLSHICEESGVGAELDESALPRALFQGKRVPLELALHGGEDYELLFTAHGKVPGRIAGVKVTRIGEIVSGSGVRMGSKRVQPRGWEHFS